LPLKGAEQPSLMNLPASLTQPAVATSSFYAEEASMYTITEDSREARSEVTSLAGTETRGGDTSIASPLSMRREHLIVGSPGSRGPILTDWNIDDSGWTVRRFDEDVGEDKPESARNSTWMSLMSSHLVPPDLKQGSGKDEDEEMSNPSDPPSEEDHFPLPLHGRLQGPRSLPMPMAEDEKPKKRPYSRKLLIYSTLVVIVLASVVVTISLPLMRQDDGSRSNISSLVSSPNDPVPPNGSDGDVGDDDDDAGGDNNTASPITSQPTEAPITSQFSEAPTEQPTITSQPSEAPTEQPTITSQPSEAPTDQPTIAPTSQPSFQPSYQPTPQPTFPQEIGTPWLEKVYEALATCQYTNLTEVIDFKKPQNTALWELSLSLQHFTPNAGTDAILERWGLIMLFFQAGGEWWTDPDDWFEMQDNQQIDMCLWSGVSCENSRITSIDLGGRNLLGVVPKELCCIPSLENLDLSSNALDGEIPSCFFEIGLTSFDYSGNAGLT